MPEQVRITACYAFVPLTGAQVTELHAELITFGKERLMKGLVLIAEEGINATVCGTPDAIAEWKERMRALHPGIVFKDSQAEKPVFRRWSVKIKPEIVTLRREGIRPAGKHRHVNPAEWDQMLKRDDVVVLDTRNSYEYSVGRFRDAIDSGTRSFHEFPEYVKKAELPKNKTVLMYCTGGIRCEKAILAMEEEGYKDVYQLEGGILAYLEQFPHGAFEGECFVFDERVAVTQKLEPSRTFKLCADCGDPVKGDSNHCSRQTVSTAPRPE